MTPDERIRLEARAPEVGKAGPFAGLSAVVEPALAAAAGWEGRRASPLSLTLALAARVVPGEPLTVEAWKERATRTLVFAAAEARNVDGAVVASASAVFKLSDSPAVNT